MKQDSEKESGRAGLRVTWIGALANLVLVLAKFIGGVLGNSQALIADAVHSVSDSVTDAVVLVGVRAGRRAPDSDHAFGHGRIETLTSAVVGTILVLVGVLLGYNAAVAVYEHSGSHPTWLALAAAIASIVVKETLYRYTIRVGQRIRSAAVIANAWHHRSDALSSVAVVVGVSAALIEPSWHILDSWAAILVAVFIVKVGLEIVWGAGKEMIDTAPAPEALERIRRLVNAVEGVLESHDLRVRTSSGLMLVQVHVLVDGEQTVKGGHAIADEVEETLLAEDDICDVIVHMDPAPLASSEE